MSTDECLRIGIVGRARVAHGARTPWTTLVGVWARRPEAAREPAASRSSQRFEKLGVGDAVVFAVPPEVRADFAVAAAHASKALLLEKPIALDLDAARRLTDVDEAGVATCYAETTSLLREHADKLDARIDALMVKETLDQADAYAVVGLLGPTTIPGRV